MKEKKIEDKYKVLDQITHILLRPATYVGSNKPNKSIKYIIEDNKAVLREITYIPSFLKIFDEILVNSVDEHKRNPKLNRIDVKIDIENNTISVRDNGGIPIVIHKEHNQYVPEVIFGNLMSGSNYDDTDERNVAGMNGLGSKCTNIFSTEFIISSCDGKKKFYQVFSNNMRSKTTPIITKSSENHTEIIYKPDLSQFGIDKIDDDHYKMIIKRIYDLAACNTGVKIYINNELVNIKSFNDYVKLYVDEFFYDSKKDDTWSLGIALSENGFQQVSFANSTETYDGGTHVDYIMNQIITSLREFFMKKHKVDVKPSDLKKHIFLFLNSTIINPSYSSQTKEKLITEVKEFGSTFEVSPKLIQSILKSEIVNSILDWILQKKNADESKLVRNLNKSLSSSKVEKLIDAKGKDRSKCSLMLFEGDSASSAVRKHRTPEIHGAFALRGKFINATELTNNKLVENREAINLMASLGLKIGQPVKPGSLRYGKIIFYMDQDLDGYSIVGLLLNFFYKYWSELFEQGMIYKAETPLIVAKNTKKKLVKAFYSNEEWNTWIEKNELNGWDIEYKKGLAALEDAEYKEIICNPVLTKIEADDFAKMSLNIWFGKDSDLRKTELLR